MLTFRIDRPTSRDELFARMNPGDMSAFDFSDRSIVLLVSKSDQKMLAAVSADASCPAGSIRLSRVFRVQLQTFLGDPLDVSGYGNAVPAESVTYSAVKETTAILTPNSDCRGLLCRLPFSHFPVTLGSRVAVYAFRHCFEFEATSLLPEGSPVIVTSADQVQLAAHPIGGGRTAGFDVLSLDDFGGYARQVSLIRSVLEAHLRGDATRSILIAAPSGCGKTFLSAVLPAGTPLAFVAVNLAAAALFD
jgi:hypothetical protein